MTAAPSTLPATILLVDDEEVVIDVLSRVFKRSNLPFVAVTRGKEAVALLEKQPFGCLITDKNLPDLSGVEVMRKARQLQPFCACIMITGYSTTESVLEVLRMGANDYLEKPFPDMKLLLQRIDSAMQHQRAEFERNTLVEALHTMSAELQKKRTEAFAEHTERQMLESLLEVRVEDATAELRKRVEALEEHARAERELSRTLVQQLEGLLTYVRGISFDETAPASMVRGVLREIERRLEESAELVREAPPAEDA